MLNKNKNNQGFTLVELLVVIAIIGILAVVAVPALFKNIEKGKVADLESDISAIRSAALSYYADKSEYPIDKIVANNNVLTDNDKLENEIEGLSDPFKATSYTLSGTAPGVLQLTITLPSGSRLSEDGFLKLQKDLGVDIVPFNNDKVDAIPGDGQNPGTPEVGANTKYDPTKPIIINLINN